MPRTTYVIPAESFAASLMAELNIPAPSAVTTRSYTPKSLFGWFLASVDASTQKPFLTLVPNLDDNGNEDGSYKGAYVALRPSDTGLFEVPDSAKCGGIHNAEEVLESVKQDSTILNSFVRAVAEASGMTSTNVYKALDDEGKRGILLSLANHTLITRLGDGGLFLVWDRAITKS